MMNDIDRGVFDKHEREIRDEYRKIALEFSKELRANLAARRSYYIVDPAEQDNDEHGEEHGGEGSFPGGDAA
jgi:hypothetical protein